MLSPRYWIFLIIVLAAIGFSMLKLSEEPEIITSPADPYSYRYMQLENGLKVLLVNTPDSDKASAAMSVNVGSMDDPAGRQGLAHFLEHMLFLGTEPFPEPDEYQQFIKQNGGSHNAFTSYAQTTYFFDIDNEQLPGALDRFAPFFISPAFNAEYVDREKNAVHAEYSSNLKEDGRRIFSAQKMAMNPEFGFSEFATGNLDTLSDRPDSKIRDELIHFYETHYSSDRMTLVIAGNYELDQLANWARGHFSTVPQRDVSFSRPDVPVFVPEQLPLDMNIEPVKEIRRLQFTFPLPEVESQYAYKPVSLLSNLIGHEGEGSILALLKQKGWAESLSAGRSLSTEHASTLAVTIGLTREGLVHVDDITRILMRYIELLKEQPLPEYLKEEQKLLNEMMFRYQEHGQLSDYVIRLSSNMLLFPEQDIIYGNYRAELPSNELMQRYLAGLSPENMLRTLVAPGVVTDTTDPWYDTNIRIRPSDYNNEREVEGLDTLHLPAANPFIPEDFSMSPDPATDTPEILISTTERQVWYYPEHDFQMPKSQALVRLQIPEVQNNGRQRLLANLYTRAVNEALNTYSYPATLAGLSYRLVATDRGLEIAVGGYQDKLPELLGRVLAAMKSTEITEAEFARYKASLQRSLENNLKAKPFQRTVAELKNWIIDPSFSDTDLLPLLDNIQLNDVTAFAGSFADNLSVVMYVHGAMSAADARALAAIVDSEYPATAAFTAMPEVVKVPAGTYQQTVQQDHPDKAMTLYMQGSDTSDKTRAEFGLLAQMISSPYYQYMRTEQQLGYIVFATAFPQKSVPGLLFIVQSPNASPDEMMNHTRIFFRNYAADISSISEEEFALFRQGLITLLLEKPKNMGDKAAYFWGEINSERFTFDSRKAIAAEVEKLQRTEIQHLYDSLINGSGKSWLLFEKGGQSEDMAPLSDVSRAEQPRFTEVNLPVTPAEND